MCYKSVSFESLQDDFHMEVILADFDIDIDILKVVKTFKYLKLYIRKVFAIM